tara:strand:+ start:2046 stop:2159 length:114 start_codon:yes stop_codon:yes gene_type:complete
LRRRLFCDKNKPDGEFGKKSDEVRTTTYHTDFFEKLS